MFGKNKKEKVKRRRESRIRELGQELDDAIRARRFKEALNLVLILERMEPRSYRWPHKRGDILRKLNKKPEAVQAYEAAVLLYAEMGFLPRAIAMAKVILDLDPGRIDILEKIDATTARDLHRRLRPEAVHAGDDEPERSVYDQAEDLVPVEEEHEQETRFSMLPPGRETLELDLQDAEFADRMTEELDEVEVLEEGDEDVPADALEADPEAGADASRAEAERQACLPFFPLFAEAPREAMLQLAHESELVRLSDGEYVYRKGEASDALYGIVEGAVRVVLPQLDERRYPRLAEGDVFGESSLLGNEPRRTDLRAEGELLALRIPKVTLNFLVRAHAGLAEVLIEMMTRRQLGNFVHTSDLFAELDALSRRAIASEFEIRRARVGTILLRRGKRADGVYMTLTGHVEIDSGDDQASAVEGAGVMFGHAAARGNTPSTFGVTARDTLLLLRWPREAFERIAGKYPSVAQRIAALEPLARVDY